MQDPAFSIGFTFVGHLAFDPTGASGSDLFAADNGAGCVWRIERATGARRPFVSGLLPRMGGLSFRADGTLCASRITDDGEVGEIWEIAPRPVLAAAAREFPRVDARAQSPTEPREDGGSAGPRQVPDSARPVLTQPASSVGALRSGEGLFRRQRTVPRERRSSGMPNLAWDDLVFLVDLESPVRTRGRRGVVLPLLPSA